MLVTMVTTIHKEYQIDLKKQLTTDTAQLLPLPGLLMFSLSVGRRTQKFWTNFDDFCEQ